MSHASSRFFAWVLLGAFALIVASLLISVWMLVGARVDFFVAAMLALLYGGLGCMMVGAWGPRVVQWLQILAAVCVLLSFVLVGWQQLWPWSSSILGTLKVLLYLGVAAFYVFATVGWVRFAGLGGRCFDHLETTETSKESDE